MGDANSPLRVGICGWGTVAQALFAQLVREREILADLAGREITCTLLGSRSGSKGIDLGTTKLIEDVQRVASSDVDVVVELIGGTDAAFDIVHTALAGGKSVVTANKALLAERGGELEAGAEKLWYSAAVGGAVPMLEHIREGIGGDRVDCILAILNGTSNYLLTQMSANENATMDALIEDAVARGYAEADPSLDVDGFDAGHKLQLLSRVAFGTSDAPRHQSIRPLLQCDFVHARLFGFCIKPVAYARRGQASWVAPCLLDKEHSLASVDGSLNALSVDSRYAGTAMLTGYGAGGEPTAAAVVADLLRVARAGKAVTTPVQSSPDTLDHKAADDQPRFKRYVRTHLLDRAGALAELMNTLAKAGISLDSVEQESASAATQAGVVTTLVTQPIEDASADATVEAIDALDATTFPTLSMRVLESSQL